MIWVPSSNYLETELALEFGNLPACAIPVMGRALLRKQLEFLRSKFVTEQIVLTLPAGYEPSNAIQLTIDDFDVSVEFFESNLKLVEIIRRLFKIYKSSLNGQAIRILLGDTLVQDIPYGKDVLAVAVPEFSYNYQLHDDSLVYCGYYSMSNIRSFGQLINESNDFESFVQQYETANEVEIKQVKKWYDFGHAQMYYSAKKQFLMSRVFNRMSVDGNTVLKFGPEQKLRSESLWFTGMPDLLKQYSAKYLGSGASSDGFYYRTKYYSRPTLNDLYVLGNLSQEHWKRILVHVENFLTDSKSVHAGLDTVQAEIAKKAWTKSNMCKINERVSLLADVAPFNLDDIIINGKLIETKKILTKLAQTDFSKAYIPAYSHGDLCFSNIIYSLHEDSIYLIDPKGIKDDYSIGNLTYDLAKLAHSCTEHYDDILATNYLFYEKQRGEYWLEFFDKQINNFMDDWILTIAKKFGVDLLLLRKLTGSLFISMVPLHSEDAMRQKVLYLNGLIILSECFND